MADTGKIAKNLERFAQAVAAHDRENPTHTAYGIGLAHFDMERLGFEEGEEILPGITIHARRQDRATSACCATASTTRAQSEAEQEVGRGGRHASRSGGRARRSTASRAVRQPRHAQPGTTAPAPPRARRSSRPAARSSGTQCHGAPPRAAPPPGSRPARVGARGDVALHRAAERRVRALELGRAPSAGSTSSRPRPARPRRPPRSPQQIGAQLRRRADLAEQLVVRAGRARERVQTHEL